MQGNTTEIDERNLLRLDALLSHGYGLSPQLVMRSKGLSIEAKALYGYLSSFAGAGDTAFPSTSRILEELDISKKNFLATCLAGVIILFAMGLFPNLLSGFSGGEISGFKGDMWSSVCASVALMLIVIKSGTIARDVFGG